MRIPLDRRQDAPLYRQLAEHLRRSIGSRSLPPGARLPSTRALARDLGVNRITVEAAYAELAVDGLVASRAGSGTHVLRRHAPSPGRRAPAAWPRWQQDLASSASGGPAADAEVGGAGPDRAIPFDGGLGDPQLYPAEEFRKVLQQVLRRDGADALGYAERGGDAGLRATIAEVLGSQGLQARPEDVLVTSGSQQALALVTGLLLGPGDTVLVERPTYAGALDLFRAQGLRVVGVPTDADGMRTDELEPLLLQHHPRLIYTIPTFQNPTGACLAPARRRRLLELADRHHVPLLEDDFVGDLRYDGRAQPPLKAWDPGGRVLYVSTFSKMLMPGLRVGFLVAEGPVLDRLRAFKAVHDLAGCSAIQRAVDEYVTVGRYEAHLRRCRRLYRARREAMLLALRRHLPPAVRFTAPRGGLFLWVRLPAGLSSERLLPLAREEGVRFAPGGRFFPDPAEGAPFVRLNFAALPAEAIDEGVRRLGRAMWRSAGPARRRAGR